MIRSFTRLASLALIHMGQIDGCTYALKVMAVTSQHLLRFWDTESGLEPEQAGMVRVMKMSSGKR